MTLLNESGKHGSASACQPAFSSLSRLLLREIKILSASFHVLHRAGHAPTKFYTGFEVRVLYDHITSFYFYYDICQTAYGYNNSISGAKFKLDVVIHN